ncbi:MAG: AbrB/MazE/SpoVT family DNA-binding domain-containing protein [Candidatus Woesearchaeota archaeon]
MIKMDFEVTKIGERGQVVIPQPLRELLSINKGDKFIVTSTAKDTLTFKKMTRPDPEEFRKLLEKTQEHARTHNLTEKDMWEAIRKVRGRRK